MKLITTTHALAEACASLARHPYVAVDTEFMRETTFWPKLCLIQMAGPDDEVLVDPLANLDLAPFYALMANRDVVKVFHAARQDVEIVHIQAKTIPFPLFDTQVAAMVCGFGDSISYVNLVKQVTGAELDKSSRFTDWARRPLSQKQLAYALNDVTHLRQVYAALSERLGTTGRSHWLAEEMAVLTDPRSYENPPEESWRRLKAKVRGRKSLAVLIELAAWRERMAQAQDVPRNRVLRDEALYDIANQLPTDTASLSELRTLSEGFARSARAKDIIEAVNRGLARDLKALPAVENGVVVPPDKVALVDLLRVMLRAVAARNGVAARLIADTEDLERIAVEREPDVAALRGWRREMFGADALRLKAGELALTVERGEVATLSVPKGEPL
ncbi:MAG: ribonuclease D [Gammaproteobacteria bacterium]|nr:ribonuclease D [Gammaproteobacteria bacterium]